MLSSTKEKKWVIEPYPSSPGSPFSSRSLALSLRSDSRGASISSKTKAAKRDDRGQPWWDPSSIVMRRQLPSSH